MRIWGEYRGKLLFHLATWLFNQGGIRTHIYYHLKDKRYSSTRVFVMCITISQQIGKITLLGKNFQKSF